MWRNFIHRVNVKPYLSMEHIKVLKINDDDELFVIIQIILNYANYSQLCKLFTIMQIICNYTNYLHLCKLFAIMQIICNYANYSQLCKLFSIMQIIRNYANYSQLCKLFRIMQIISCEVLLIKEIIHLCCRQL